MRLPDDVDEREGLAPPIISALGAVCAIIILIVAVVLFLNRDKLSQNNTPNAGTVTKPTQTTNQESVEVGSSSLSPDDFDFWEMYPEPTPAPVVEETEDEQTQ